MSNQTEIVDANKMAPPGCLPFNLSRALAGAKAITRGGFLARNLRRWGNFILATVGNEDSTFDLDGIPAGGSAESANRLFLDASEEGEAKVRCVICSICHDDMTGQEGIVCLKCRMVQKHPGSPKLSPSASQPQGVEKQTNCPIHGKRLPKPGENPQCCSFCGLDTSSDASPPQSETQRQAQVMLESEKPGAVVQWRSKAKEPGEWMDCVEPPSWAWDCTDYRLRAAPEPKPRRVWITFRKDDESIGFSSYEKPPALREGVTQAEFIELTPSIRALLEEKGMM